MFFNYRINKSWNFQIELTGFLLVLLITAYAPVAHAQLVINEVCSSNFSNLSDEDGDFEDWIELYNSSEDTINIKGYSLTDTRDDPGKWECPGLKLPPKEYLIIFASDKNRNRVIRNYQTTIFATDTFKYISPTFEPDPQWRNNTFNDTAWLTGQEGFGHGEGIYNTEVSDTLMSVFIRKTFQVANISNIVNGQLHVDYDDAFVAFLNGDEIARNNIRPDGAIPEYNQAALHQHPSHLLIGEAPELFTVNHEKLMGLLTEGENVLALQLHNNWLDAEMSINPFFSYGIDTNHLYFAPTPYWFYHDTLPLHTNFKLDSDGEPLLLFDGNGNLIDELEIPALPVDVSYGRTYDDSVSYCFYREPSPGFSNNALAKYVGITQGVPEFSKNAGLYNLTFPDSLTIEIFAPNPGDVVRFTLNGNTPADTSMLYTQAIGITKTTVLKARLFAGGKLPGKVVTATYIINKSTNLPVVSITTDSANLWDYETGIYVKGPDAANNFPYYGANFWRDVEIQVCFEYFGTAGERLLIQDAGMKIHGGWSRAFNQRSLRLIARGSFGKSKFDYPFFPDKNIGNFDKLILRNAGNDFQGAHLRDGLIHKMVQGKTQMATQDYQPVVVYLNGEYWGIQNLREKIDTDYLFENFALDDQNINLLENKHEVIEGDKQDFIDLHEFIMNHDLSIHENYETVCQQLDIPGLIDYFAVQLFIINTDWPQNNTKYWKHVNSKWQYIFMDADNAMNFISSLQYHDIDSYQRILENPTSDHSHIFIRLLENEDFKICYINRTADLMNSIFKPANSIAFIDTIKDSLIGEMAYHKARWGGSVSIWESHHINNKLKTFFINRPDYFRYYTATAFGLDTNIYKLNLETVNGEGSHIGINSLTPDQYPWTGLYYDSVPLILRALPAPGMEFLHWEENGEIISTDLQIQWFLQNDDTLKAHFTGVPDTLKPNISEICYQPYSAMEAGDWIEMYNPHDEDIDISGWKLKNDNNFSQFIFEENTTLQAGEFLVVAQDSLRFASVYPELENFTGPFDFGLRSYGDVVRLFDENENLIVSLKYYASTPWPEGAAGSGRSIELIAPGLDMNQAGNWRLGCLGGSPGQAPIDCHDEYLLIFSEFNYKSHPNMDAGDWVEIYNRDSIPVNFKHWKFKDSDRTHVFMLPDSLTLQVGGFLVLCEDTTAFRACYPDSIQIVGNFDFGLSPSSDHLRLYDPWDNLVSEVDYNKDAPWPQNIDGTGRTAEVIDIDEDVNQGSNWRDGCLGGSPGQAPIDCHDEYLVIFSEFNYKSHPNMDAGDWVEIYNRDSIPVNFKHWKFKDSDKTQAFMLPDSLTLQVGEFLVLCEDTTAFRACYPDSIQIVGNFDFGLSSSGDHIQLYDPWDNLVSEVDYSNDTPWPQNIDGTGRTAEVIDIDEDVNQGSNWRDGCHGGSPGQAPIDCHDEYLVIFSEFNYKSHPNMDAGDWVEIYNRDSIPVNLKHWKFKDSDKTQAFMLPDSLTLQVGGFLVLCEDTTAFRACYADSIQIAGNFDFGLSSSGDHLQLYDLWDNLVSEVDYSSDAPWPQNIDGTGRTAEVIDINEDVNQGSNWRDGCLGGSPGRFPGTCYDTANIIVTEINFKSANIKNTGDWLEIYNHDTLAVDLSGWTFRDANTAHEYLFPEELWLDAGKYLVLVEDSVAFASVHDTISQFIGSFGFGLSTDEDEIHLYDKFGQEIINISYMTNPPWPGNDFAPGRTLELRDYNGNLNDPGNWELGCFFGSPGRAHLPCEDSPGIIVTEIQFDSGDEDDAGDWIEIYNPGGRETLLYGWTFRDSDPEHLYQFPDETIILPGAYLVVVENSADFLAVYDSITNFVGGFGFGLSADADEIHIRDGYHNEIISFGYQSSGDWPQNPAAPGRSFELANYSENPANPTNWMLGCYLGSPGKAYVECDDISIPEIYPSGISVRVHPNPFGESALITIKSNIETNVHITLQNIQGMEIMDVFKGKVSPESFSLPLNTSSLKNGIYLLRITSPDNVSVVKILKY